MINPLKKCIMQKLSCRIRRGESLANFLIIGKATTCIFFKARFCGKDVKRTFIETKERWNGYICPIVVESPIIRDKSLDYFIDHNVDAFVL